jgi:hypothetical protein
MVVVSKTDFCQVFDFQATEAIMMLQASGIYIFNKDGFPISL